MRLADMVGLISESADPIYLELAHHASDQQVWFMVTGDLKNGGYKGLQVVHWVGDRKPKKAVQKTIDSGAMSYWKRVQKQDLPPEVLSRFP